MQHLQQFLLDQQIRELEMDILHKFYLDEELQRLDQQPKIPQLLCKNNHQVTSICIDSQCSAKIALCCNKKQCDDLSVVRHRRCLDVIAAAKLSDLLQSQRKEVKNLLLGMLRIESQFFIRLRNFSQELVDKYKHRIMDHEHKQIIQQLWKGNANIELSSGIAKKIAEDLVGRSQQIQHSSKDILEEYQRRVEDLEMILNTLKEDGVEAFIFGKKFEPRMDKRIQLKEEESSRQRDGRQGLLQERQNLLELKGDAETFNNSLRSQKLQILAQIEQVKKQLERQNKWAKELSQAEDLEAQEEKKENQQPSDKRNQHSNNVSEDILRPSDEKMYRSMIQTNPGNQQAHVCLGLICEQTHRLQEAQQLYRKALKINPHYAHALSLLGNLCAESKRAKESEQLFRRSIQLDPNDSYSLSYLANIYSSSNRLEEAMQLYKTCLKLDPNNVAVLNNCARTCQMLKKKNQAQKLYNKAIQINPRNFTATINLANLYYSSNRFQEAENLYCKAIEINPTNTIPYTNLGSICLLSNRLQESEDYLNTAIQLDPNNQMAKERLKTLKTMEQLYSQRMNVHPSFFRS